MEKTSFNGLLKRVASTAAIVLLGAGAFSAQNAVAGIANTKHNLGSSTGPADRNNSFSGTAEICVFCHTPHGSDTSAAVPLWNRKMDATGFTTYNSLGTSSLDGAVAPVGSVSLACLSCHDGTQAMNVMINQPGSGGYNPAGAALAGTWTGTGQLNDTSKITTIGKDLQNDHPIGIQYAGGPKGAVPVAGVDYTNANFRDADFKTAKSATLNGNSVWWVDTSNVTVKGVSVTTVAGTREKTDMQLYTRTSAIGLTDLAGVPQSSSPQPFVECASCHDPHSDNVTFLRIDNTGSAVCLACHTK